MRIVAEGKRFVNVGDRFGRLVVVGVPFYLRSPHGKAWKAVVCECDCGGFSCPAVQSLVKRCSKSCGCLKHDVCGSYVHGMFGTRIYHTWQSMNARCSNPNHKNWPRYGGRGIRVCDEWRDFIAFHSWAIKNGYAENLTIERINNDRGYCPENCCWATIATQSRNKSSNHFVTAFGETRVLKDWLNDSRSVVNPGTARHRFKKGWTMEDAILTPLLRNRDKKVVQEKK